MIFKLTLPKNQLRFLYEPAPLELKNVCLSHLIINIINKEQIQQMFYQHYILLTPLLLKNMSLNTLHIYQFKSFTYKKHIFRKFTTDGF